MTNLLHEIIFRRKYLTYTFWNVLKKNLPAQLTKPLICTVSEVNRDNWSNQDGMHIRQDEVRGSPFGCVNCLIDHRMWSRAVNNTRTQNLFRIVFPNYCPIK